MQIFDRRVDQCLLIGPKIKIRPTDIDPQGIRLLVDGEILGGPDDGGHIHKAIELAVGSVTQIGLSVSVHVLSIQSGVVRLGIDSNRPIQIQTEDHRP